MWSTLVMTQEQIIVDILTWYITPSFSRKMMFYMLQLGALLQNSALYSQSRQAIVVRLIIKRFTDINKVLITNHYFQVCLE